MPAVPAELNEWVLNRLVSAHFRILKAVVFGHLLNAAMIVASFWKLVPAWPLCLWAGAMLLMCGQRVLLAREGLSRSAWRKPALLIRKLETNSILIGILWALAIALLFGRGNEVHHILLSIVGISIVAAAAFTMRMVPRAAIIFIGLVSGAMTMSLLLHGPVQAIAAAFLTATAGWLLSRMVVDSHALFVTRIVRDRQLSASMETVRMLLSDFQDHGSDWLFELDEQGAVLSPSARFAEALGVEQENLNARRFELLFADTPERQQLKDHLANRRNISGLSLPLVNERDGATRWWSISGRAVNGPGTGGVRFRGVISDVSAEKQAQQRVRHMAHFDGLTGLPNRLMFNNALAMLVAKGIVADRAVLLLVDVDNFKSVNDSLGHPIGDLFLKAVSARLVECVARSGVGGEGHIVARLGGDEFAILMAGEDAADHSIRLAAQLVDRMAEPFLIEGHPILSGVSIGLAVSPMDGETAESLMRNADLALYCAKDGGRGKWERFDVGLDLAVRDRHLMEKDLRAALSRDEMRLYFQPLVDVASGRQAGFEALLRWESASRGMVMPDDFIPLAEETGLIVPLGEWVIRSAIAEAATWQEPLMVAVNVSPVQMRSPNLLPTIMNALANSGLSPERFEVEITEGVLLNDSEANIALLHRMRSLGIKVALDDFGTGYSSLNYLRTFPFDKIKIDRSFVNDLENREDSRAIVSAVIALAQSLGMVTLAEGVEHDGQLNQLRADGCSMAQGWLFGKAMPAEHYASMTAPPARTRRKAA